MKSEIDKITEDFIFTVLQNEYVPGIVNYTDIFLLEQYKISIEETNKWLIDVFFKNYDNTKICNKIIFALSRIPYEILGEYGQKMALAGLYHTDIECLDASLRCFEYWDKKETLPLIRHRKFKQEFLNEYLESIIRDIDN